MNDLIAISIATSAAIVLASNYYLQRYALKSTDPVIGAFLSVATLAISFWILSPLFVDWAWLSHPSIYYFMLAGLLFPAMGQFLQIRAIGLVGPAMTAAVGSGMPFFAAIPAVLFLGEDFGLKIFLGLMLMVSGIAWAAIGTGKLKRTFPIWALLLPIGASASRGVVQPLTKIGYLDIPSPFFATMIMGTVSTVLLFAIVLATGKAKVLTNSGKSNAPFLLVGLINAFGVFLINAAVSLGEITMVSPFISTIPIWVLLLGWAVFRVETLTLKHLGVAILVVAGAILIVGR